jgi:hypothetical protein
VGKPLTPKRNEFIQSKFISNMTYEQFVTILMNYKRYNEITSEAYDVGLDLLEGKYSIVSQMEQILETCFLSHYTEEGWEWISWFTFENEYGQGGLEARDENGNLIFQSFLDAYEELEKNYKLQK